MFTANTIGCSEPPTLAGAFTYEGNAGGFLDSISVGWGFLSVSYSGASMTLQKSSNPLYVEYHRSDITFGDILSCMMHGASGGPDDWFDYQCSRNGNYYEFWQASI